MRKTVAILALTLSLALAASACASDSKPITATSLSSKLVSEGKLTKKYADCVAQQLVPAKKGASALATKDQLTKSEKEGLNSPTPTVSNETVLYAKVKKAGEACIAKGVTP